MPFFIVRIKTRMKTESCLIIFIFIISTQITFGINKNNNIEPILLLDIKKKDCQKTGDLWNEAIKQCIPNININNDQISTSQELKKKECFAKNQLYAVQSGEIGKCYKRRK